MTLANRITVFRLLLIPVFVVLVMTYTREEPQLRIAALVTFIVAALSDAADGFVARAYNQKTRLGAVLDPLADKLFINITYVFLAVSDQFATRVPAWLPVILLSRDIIIVMGSYLINEFFGPIRVRAKFSGKITTALQMAAVIAVLLEFRFAWHLLMAMAAFSVISFFDYLYDGFRRIGTEDAA